MAGRSKEADGVDRSSGEIPKKLERSEFFGDIEPPSSGSGLGIELDGLRNIFDKLFVSFREKVHARGCLCSFPPMVGGGQPVDLFSLFLAVRRRGGYSAVSENSLWSFVAEECGLDLIEIPSIKLVYVKFLEAFDRFLERFVESNNSRGRELSSGLLGLNQDLGGFLLELDKNTEYPQLEASAVSNSKELEKSNGGEDLQTDSTKQIVIFGEVETGMANSEDVVGSPGADKKGGTGDNTKKGSNKRKRQPEPGMVDWITKRSVSGMVNWLTKVARNPRHPSVGSIPERSDWDSSSAGEVWKQVLLFRDLTFIPRGGISSAADTYWQNTQRMHPFMYTDPEKSGKNLRAGDDMQLDESSDSPTPGSTFDYGVECHVPIGPDFQAELPEWTGLAGYESKVDWLGTRTWPPRKNETNVIERDPMGKGRPESCGCQNPGSTECVQFHVGERRSKLKLELGSAFYLWKLHKMGENVSIYWMEADRKVFDKILKSTSPSDDKDPWEELRKRFPNKTRDDLVSYYFNVYLSQRRAHQNRNTPTEIDSDDDGAGSSEHPVKLTPRKTPKKRSR